jgi:hypothetical protein
VTLEHLVRAQIRAGHIFTASTLGQRSVRIIFDMAVGKFDAPAKSLFIWLVWRDASFVTYLFVVKNNSLSISVNLSQRPKWLSVSSEYLRILNTSLVRPLIFHCTRIAKNCNVL